MTQTATGERVKLAQIVAAGIHQLAAAAAHQVISDRIQKGRADLTVWDSIDAVAGNMAQPYISALMQLAGVESLTAKTCNETFLATSNPKEAGNDEQDRRDTGIQGTHPMHGRPTRRGRKAKA